MYYRTEKGRSKEYTKKRRKDITAEYGRGDLPAPKCTDGRELVPR